MAASAFETIVRTHAPAVHAYAHAITNDRWLAEEAIQETFVRAWKYQDSFRGTGSYEGWLLRICRNVMTDLAARQRNDRSIDEVSDLAATTNDAATTGEIGDAMATLSVDHREVLTVCGVLGYDYESAASLLGVPVGTVRSRLHRARALLAETLGQNAPTEAA